ncbi:hypothetical protein FEM03_12200 [Phragmitibacter flavus]|uniref:Uncharacterized protein n=2 Tax=Phragmitibacter flavus TaxID=2576071 RepID=A0A5R8KDU9_9BACT|nr:hypothetical protein FEM03_12200 [Phragmitibacter flavus]
MEEEFYSIEHDGPFQECSRCSASLIEGQPYQINKAWRAGECIFEYAFCAVCRDALLAEFSEESKGNLLNHQEQHMRDGSKGTEECAFCGSGRPGIANQDFTTTALCERNEVLDSLLICFTCQAGMHELLSQQTKDVRRRFFEEVPGVPPDWEVWKPDESEIHQVTAPMNQPIPLRPTVPVGALAILGVPQG